MHSSLSLPPPPFVLPPNPPPPPPVCFSLSRPSPSNARARRVRCQSEAVPDQDAYIALMKHDGSYGRFPKLPLLLSCPTAAAVVEANPSAARRVAQDSGWALLPSLQCPGVASSQRRMPLLSCLPLSLTVSPAVSSPLVSTTPLLLPRAMEDPAIEALSLRHGQVRTLL